MNRNVLTFLMEDDNMDMNVILYVAQQLQEPVFALDNENTETLVRNTDYYEQTIPQYTDDQFYRHFRMSRKTFDVSNLIQLCW